MCFKLSNLILSHYSFIHLDYVYIIEHFRLIFVIVLMSTFNIQIMKQVSKFFVVHVCFEIRNEWSSIDSFVFLRNHVYSDKNIIIYVMLQ